MTSTPRPDVEGIKARADLVKKGRPLRVALVGVRHVERKCPECGTEFVTPYSDKRYCSPSCRVRVGRRYIARARQDTPTLITYIKALEERMGKLEAVVEAAREFRQSLEDDDWDRDAIEHGLTRPGLANIMKALAALDSPEEQKAMEAEGADG